MKYKKLLYPKGRKEIMQITIKNSLINYEILGEGKPILMLHGFYPDHRLMSGCMEPVFRDIEGYKRIYIDLPGMGKSQSSNSIKNSDEMLEAVIEFIEKIIGKENFLIAGESYGGYIARGIIYKLPERIDGAAFICPVIEPINEERNVPKHVVLVKDTKLLSGLPIDEAEDFNQSFVVQSKKICERNINEIMSGVRLANSEFLEGIRKNGYGFSFNADELKEKFEKPSLMLLGRQDSVVGYKDAWSILDNFPRLSFVVLDRAGHNLQLEQEELFNEMIKEWLSRVK